MVEAREAAVDDDEVAVAGEHEAVAADFDGGAAGAVGVEAEFGAAPECADGVWRRAEAVFPFGDERGEVFEGSDFSELAVGGDAFAGAGDP